MSIFDKILGDPNKRYLNNIQPIVEQVNSQESEFEKLSTEELREKSFSFKERIKKEKREKILDDILPEAFALTREAAKRTLKQRHFDVQVICGIVLHQGKIAEMVTGEGKTLAATLPAYLNALTGEGVHIITVNDYLAKRDTVWMGQIYNALGLSVGCIVHDTAYIYDSSYQSENSKFQIPNNKQAQKQSHRESLSATANDQNSKQDEERDEKGGFKIIESYLRPCSRKEAYLADITYGTNNEFGFDYLRDNMAYDLETMVQRKHCYAIIDEVDSILIDEARTPLIISQPDIESSEMYKDFAQITPRLKEDSDYNVDEKMKAISLTEEGISRVEDIVGVKNIYAEKGMKYLHYLEQALKAQILFKKDKDYIIREDQIIIVDQFTGRLMPGRRYSGGLHQAIEAKERVKVQAESLTLASVTFQNYFRQYEKLAGMTGTAVTSAEEFDKVYKLGVICIPTNKLLIREKMVDKIFKNEKGKFKAIVKDIKKRHKLGQPVLIGTTSIEKNEYLGKLLEREGIVHNILNAKNHKQEGEIIAQAGKLEAVTVATNMAGRGVDIVLGGNPPDPQKAEEVKKLGGLCVIGTERHEARRIDNQLRGRAGRQGDPGVSQFFVSLEDDLLRIFGGDRVKKLMERFNFPEDEPIEIGLASRGLEEAQSKIEGMNLDLRKHLLEYDEILNKHREIIYRKRREIIKENNLKNKILEILEKEPQKMIDCHCVGNLSNWNLKEISEEVKAIMVTDSEQVYSQLKEICKLSEPLDSLRDKIFNYLRELFKEQYLAKEERIGQDDMRQLEKIVLLRTLDFLWTDHLTMMDYLRDSVKLRAYGQLDPLVEYKTEGRKIFQELLLAFENNVARTIFKAGLRREPQFMMGAREGPLSFSKSRRAISSPNTVTPSQSSHSVPKAQRPGRNAPCPCGSGKKYKKCCGK